MHHELYSVAATCYRVKGNETKKVKFAHEVRTEGQSSRFPQAQRDSVGRIAASET